MKNALYHQVNEAINIKDSIPTYLVDNGHSRHEGMGSRGMEPSVELLKCSGRKTSTHVNVSIHGDDTVDDNILPSSVDVTTDGSDGTVNNSFPSVDDEDDGNEGLTSDVTDEHAGLSEDVTVENDGVLELTSNETVGLLESVGGQPEDVKTAENISELSDGITEEEEETYSTDSMDYRYA